MLDDNCYLSFISCVCVGGFTLQKYHLRNRAFEIFIHDEIVLYEFVHCLKHAVSEINNFQKPNVFLFLFLHAHRTNNKLLCVHAGFVFAKSIITELFQHMQCIG